MNNYLLIISIHYILQKKCTHVQASYRLHKIQPHTHKSVGYFIRDIIMYHYVCYVCWFTQKTEIKHSESL